MDQPFELSGSDAVSLLGQARSLLGGQRDLVANAANLSALLYQSLEDVNWVGFYFLKAGELVVGPFQGKPACVRIPLGQGVCGTAAATRRVQRVADVDRFAGHIACDGDSRSEIVVPLIEDGVLRGVLDVDSPVRDRFSEEDEAGIVRLAEIYLDSIS